MPLHSSSFTSPSRLHLTPPHQVRVLEASSAPLAKVLISGGGRCNVLHDPMKGADVIAQVKKRLLVTDSIT